MGKMPLLAYIKKYSGLAGRKKRRRPSVPITRTIGVIGTGKGVGVTHFAIVTAGYISGVQGHRICVLEWNHHGDLERLKELCLEGKGQRPFRILTVDYYEDAGTKELLLCKTMGYEDVIVDYGTAMDGNFDQFLRCDRQFVVGSISEWQAKAFLDFAGKWKRAERTWETLAVFGSEESRKKLEKKLGISIRRIPVSVDAFLVTGEIIEFYQIILR